MIKNILLVFTLVFVVATRVEGQRGGGLKVTEYNLPNGLHIVLHSNNRASNVMALPMYRVGTKNEDVPRTGCVNFFEHLLFENSKYTVCDDYIQMEARSTPIFFRLALVVKRRRWAKQIRAAKPVLQNTVLFATITP